MSDLLLKAIQARQQKQTEFGYGVLTADRYVRNVVDAVGLDRCYQFGSTRTTSWNDVVEKAARTLVYSNEDMVTEEIEYSKRANSSLRFWDDDIELPKNTLMVFRHVLTTSRKDRDGDVLRTAGAQVDPKMLLLWQHVHTIPIGKMLAIDVHNAKKLSLVSCIIDVNEVCHDSAVMIDNGMGRFSHGFRAIDFSRAKARDGQEAGFDVKQFEIMEASLVSVPANVDADVEEVVLSLVEGGKLKSPMMKSYGKSIRDKQPSRITLPVDLKITFNGEEIEDGEIKGVGTGTGSGTGQGQDGPGTSKETDGDSAKGRRQKEQEAATDDEMKCPECGAMIPKSSEECPECGADLFDVEGFAGTEKSGRSFSGENFATIKSVYGDVRTLDRGHHVRDKAGIDICKKCSKQLKGLIKEYDVPIGKSARAISADNLTKLKEAYGDLKEIDQGDHVLTDKGRPIATRAARTLGGLVEKYSMDEAETGKSFVIEDAMATVIVDATPAQRQRIKQAFAALEKVEQANRRAAQLRSYVGR